MPTNKPKGLQETAEPVVEHVLFWVDQDETSMTVISAQDELNIGPGGDLETLNSKPNVSIYANQVKLHGSIPANNVRIFAKKVVGVAVGDQGAVLDASGAPPIGQSQAQPERPKAKDGQNARRNNVVKDGSTPGAAGVNGVNGNNGAKGASGNAVEITVFQLPANEEIFEIRTSGGKGQRGQDGQKGQDGGNGGSGCTFYPGPINKNPSNGGNGGEGGKGGDGGEGGDGGPITIKYLSGNAAADCPFISSGEPHDACLIALGGDGGDGGDGAEGGAGGKAGKQWDAPKSAKDGRHGAAGKNGSKGIAGHAGAVACTPISMSEYALEAHPQQLVMDLQRLKMAFLAINPQALDTTKDRTHYLQTTLADLDRLIECSEVYAQQGQDLGKARFSSARDIEFFSMVYNEASAIQYNIRMGQDYFGYTPDRVPLVSFEAYKKWFTTKMDTLTRIETYYSQYLAAGKKAQAALDQHKDICQTANDTIQAWKNELELITGQATDSDTQQTGIESLNTIVDDINSRQQDVDRKKVLLDAALENAKSAIEEAWNCSWKSVFSGLSMVLFMGERPLAAIAMAGIQAGSIIDTSTSTIDMDGKTIDKNYLMSQLRYCTDENELKEGYSEDKGLITQEDPNAAKLLMAKANLEQVIGKYTSIHAVARFKQSLDNYVDAVLARNQKIMLYNDMIRLYEQLSDKIAHTQRKLDLFNTEYIDTLNQKDYPDLAELTNYMGDVYTEAKSDVLKTLYWTSKAANYWSLGNGSLLFDTLGSDPPSQLDSGVFLNAELKIEDKYQSVVSRYTGPADTFPANLDDPKTRGIIYSIKMEDDPIAFQAFKQPSGEGDNRYHQFTFAIPPVLPGASLEPNDINYHPLALLEADIRLFRIRPWLVGAKAGGGKGDTDVITIELVHSGLGEEIVATNGTVFSFSHRPRSVHFSYKLGEKRDPSAIVLEPQMSLSGKELDNDTDTRQYALIGPFVMWDLFVRCKLNPGIDLSGVKRIDLELFGKHRYFDHNLNQQETGANRG